MQVSMFQVIVPRFIHTLESLHNILDKAMAYEEAKKLDPLVLPNARLFPDMLPLTSQVQIACDSAKGAACRLAGVPIVAFEDNEKTLASFRPPRGGNPPAALPALLRATHLLGLALGSAFGRLRESGATAARLFERAEESALLLRITREAAGILGARWDKVPERHRPHYAPEQRVDYLDAERLLPVLVRKAA